MAKDNGLVVADPVAKAKTVPLRNMKRLELKPGPHRTIAVVGHAPSTRAQTPVNDPTVEIYALGEAYLWLGRGDLWFEMHRLSELVSPPQPAGYLEWLRDSCPCPLLMLDAFPEFPNAKRYPREELTAKFGRLWPDGHREDFYTSTIDYMLAYAINELGPGDELRLYGVDMATDGPHSEYRHQRPGCYYYLGIAVGKGINVVLPVANSFLRAPAYGVGSDEMEAIRLDLDTQVGAERVKQQQILAELNALIGRTEGMEWVFEALTGLQMPDGLEEKLRAELALQHRKKNETLADLNAKIGALDAYEWCRQRVGD